MKPNNANVTPSKIIIYIAMRNIVSYLYKRNTYLFHFTSTCLFFLLFLTATSLSAQSKIVHHNAFFRASELFDSLGKEQFRGAVDSFNNNQSFWKKQSSNAISEEDFRMARFFVKFIKDPFFEKNNLTFIDPSKFVKIAKKYNYFAPNGIRKDTIQIRTRSMSTIESIENDSTDFDLLRTESLKTLPSAIPESYDIGLSASKIIDGAARFLVKRTKEELEVAFFDKFRQDLDKTPFLQDLIPQTALLLRYQDYNYIPSMGKTWVSAIETDLKNIPYGLSDALIKNRPDIAKKNEALLFLAAMMTAKQLKDKIVPYEILNNLDKKLEKIDNDTIPKFIHLANLLSQNLSVEGLENEVFAWVDLQQMMNLKEGKKYFWAFLYHENKDFFKKIGWSNKKIKDIAVLNLSLENFLVAAQKTGNILTAAELFNQPVKKTVGATEGLLEMVSNVILFNYVINGKGDDFYDGLFVKKYKPIIENGISLISSAGDKNYGAVLLNTLRIVSDIIPEDKKSKDENIKKMIFYLNFMTDIVTTTDAIEVQEVIERYAMPAQSYRMKRSHEMSIDLNAFPGFYVGGEQISTTKNNGFASGVTAPIGLALSFGKNNQSLSFFVPVIDIGAAFSYRWGKDANGKGFPDEITWKQVFSPGLHAVWGMAHSPLSLSAGFQFSPQLRSITDTGVVVSASTIRYGISAMIDIPLFNLWKK